MDQNPGVYFKGHLAKIRQQMEKYHADIMFLGFGTEFAYITGTVVASHYPDSRVWGDWIDGIVFSLEQDPILIHRERYAEPGLSPLYNVVDQIIMPMDFPNPNAYLKQALDRFDTNGKTIAISKKTWGQTVLGLLEAAPQAKILAFADPIIDEARGVKDDYEINAQGRARGPAKYEQAAATLGFETGTETARLEAFFYRVNALLNLRRADEGKAVAQTAVERYRKGTLTIAADDPQAWFQLGKLFRDAGDPQGALEPYRRALDAHEKGPKKLRSAYLQRISDLALQQKDLDLARRAAGALGAATGNAQAVTAQEARILLAGGDLEGALAAFEKAGKGQSEATMDAQYAAAATRRALELKRWGITPATSRQTAGRSRS